MINLIRAEWFKLVRRPLSRMLLAIFLALFAVQFVAQLVLIIVLPSRTGAFGAQIAEWRASMMFPGLFGAALSHVNGLGGIFAVIFTAGALGSEYAWGTLRTQLARHPARERYLLAKLATILLMVALATLLVILLGALFGLLASPVIGGVGILRATDLLALPLAFLRALYVLLPYVLLTCYATLFSRSLLAGVAVGLLYIILESGFGALALLQILGGVWARIYDLTIGQNINTLTLMNRNVFGLHPEATSPLDLSNMPSPLQATIVIGIYSALFLGLSLYLIRKRDIVGPG